MALTSRPYSKGSSGKRKPYAAFDFETDGLGGEILAATWCLEGMEDAEYISGGDVLAKLWEVQQRHCDHVWFAHNAEYEFRYYIPRFLDLGDRVKMFARTERDIFMITVDLGDEDVLTMKDSMAVFPASLRKMLDVFCPELPKLDLDFEAETFNPNKPEHIAYAKRDSLGLVTALSRYDDLLYRTYDIHLRSTAAGCAVAAWERGLDKRDVYFNDTTNENFYRAAYYGGLVFLTDTRKIEGGRTYDLNSSYPFQMWAYPFPVGNSVRTFSYIPGKHGIYDVTVTAPDDLIVPIIPARYKGSIIWPRGEFRTHCTGVELHFAMQHGYTINKIHEGRVWHREARPFREFVEKNKTIRLNNKGNALENVAKRIQNSLYGKFGARRERRQFKTWLSPDDTVFEEWGDFYIVPEFAEDMRCLPQWAVFITAYARLHLLRTIYDIGPENVIYGDTDSLTLRPGYSLPTGGDYGDWKLEKEWTEFRASAPKVYAGIKDGELIGAIKGIPRRLWKKTGALGAVLSGEEFTVAFDSLNSFTASMKTGNIGTIARTRRVSRLSNSLSWELQRDGSVRPRPYSEIVKG